MTNLSASDITKLTCLIDGAPRGRLATTAKTVERLTKTLAEALGDPDAAAKVLDRALTFESFGGAEAILKAALTGSTGKAAEPAPIVTPVKPDVAPAPDARSATDAETAPGPAASPQRRRRDADLEAKARQGELPPPPDFSAPTHARFRNKLEGLVALAEKGDAEALMAVAINPVSSSPKALARYRDLCVIALKARVGAAA